MVNAANPTDKAGLDLRNQRPIQHGSPLQPLRWVHVKMLKTEIGTIDGIQTQAFMAGKEYDLPAGPHPRPDCGAVFIEMKSAVEVGKHYVPTLEEIKKAGYSDEAAQETFEEESAVAEAVAAGEDPKEARTKFQKAKALAKHTPKKEFEVKTEEIVEDEKPTEKVTEEDAAKQLELAQTGPEAVAAAKAAAIKNVAKSLTK